MVGEASWSVLAESLRDYERTPCTVADCRGSECPYKDGPAWSPVEIVGLRRADNVTALYALTYDLDDVADADWRSVFDGLSIIVHSTHGHRVDRHKLRVVIRLSRPVTPQEYKVLWRSVADLCGAPPDEQCKDVSRLYFLPRVPADAPILFEHHEGVPLDVDAVLATAPTTAKAPPTSTLSTAPPSVAVGDREQALDALVAAWPAKGRHAATLHLCGALAHSGWSEDDIADYVQDFRDRLYPGGDPTPTKARNQARDSVRKLSEGSAVAGWGKLAETIGEDVTAKVRGVLDPAYFSRDKANQLCATLLKYAPPKHSDDEVRTHLESVKRKLARRTNPQDLIDAKLLAVVLGGDFVSPEAYEKTLLAVVKHAPRTATTDQLVAQLKPSMPATTWGDIAAAVDAVRSAPSDDEFRCYASGDKLGMPIPNDQHNVELGLRKLGVSLAYNAFAGRKLVAREGGTPEIVQDHHEIELRFELDSQFRFLPSKEFFNDVVELLCRKNTFNPAVAYFDRVEAGWDGVPRLDNWLHRYGRAPDNAYTRAIGRLVLIAAVRRVREPGCKFDEMLILEGEQGTVQKSTAVKTLAPERGWFSDSLPLGADSKIVIERTQGKLIIEAGELRGLRPSEVAELKNFLSKEVDESRMAFGRETTIVPRQFIIIGTTNDAYYLYDPTGGRRFWPVRCEAFDISMLKRDLDQLWGEAAYYESQGESIRLDPKYYALAAKEQEARRVADPWEEILGPLLADVNGKLDKSDVWSLLGMAHAEAKPADQSRLAAVMQRLGWSHGGQRRRDKKKPYCWIKGATTEGGEDDVWLTVSGRQITRSVPSQGCPKPPKTAIR